MAIGLPCLQELQVGQCNILKGIVAKKSGEDYNGADSEKIEFVQLRMLSLKCLPQIISFYSCSAKMLPTLTERQKLLEINAHSEEIFPEEEEPTFSMPFFEEVSFPGLEELTLSKIPNVRERWNDKLEEKFYSNLKSLVLEKCPHLVNVISSNLLQLSGKLEELNVSHCDSLEEVFVVPDNLDIDEEHNGLVPRLIQLSLDVLPKLRCIWGMYHLEMLCFKNLRKLKVEKCGSLKYLFTPSIAMGLVRLQKMTIINCGLMKEIVAKEEGETTTKAILFPQLSYLCLQYLPNLITFYSVVEESASNEIIHTVKQPLFNEKAHFPILKKLKITNLDNIRSIWHNQPYEEDS